MGGGKTAGAASSLDFSVLRPFSLHSGGRALDPQLVLWAPSAARGAGRPSRVQVAESEPGAARVTSCETSRTLCSWGSRVAQLGPPHAAAQPGAGSRRAGHQGPGVFEGRRRAGGWPSRRPEPGVAQSSVPWVQVPVPVGGAGGRHLAGSAGTWGIPCARILPGRPHPGVTWGFSKMHAKCPPSGKSDGPSRQ